MKRFFLIWLLLVVPAWGTTRYAGPAGSGTTCSAGSPCSMAYLWTVTVAGDTILLNDGHYSGANFVLGPPAAKSGTAVAPITVSAVNDGEVWFDGRDGGSGTADRHPCLFNSNNDYFVLSGFNCSNSTTGAFSFNSGSDHNIVRRVGAWGGNPNANYHVFAVNQSSFENLFEDCFGFSAGGGRKVFTHFAGSGNTIVRRCFFLWKYHLYSGPKMALSQYYNSKNLTIENCIFGWDETAGYSTQENYGPLFADRMDAATEAERKINLKVLGSIVLQPNAWTYTSNLYGASGTEKVGAVEYNNVAVFLGTNKSAQQGFYGRNCYQTDSFTGTECVTPSLALSNSSFIGGATIVAENHWVQTNVATGANVAAVYGAQSLWDNDGTVGAEICKRYENGTLTSTPIFDADGLWPTNQRILDAMADAGLTGTANAHDAPVNISTLLVSIFGAIPAACKAGGAPSAAITLTYPNSGANFTSGNTATITWQGVGLTTGDLTVSVSRDGGSNYSALSTTVAYTATSYQWTVVTPKSATVRFKVCQGAACGESTGNSAIKGRLTGIKP